MKKLLALCPDFHAKPPSSGKPCQDEFVRVRLQCGNFRRDPAFVHGDGGVSRVRSRIDDPLRGACEIKITATKQLMCHTNVGGPGTKPNTFVDSRYWQGDSRVFFETGR